MECYADVILPLPINKYFTYRIPEELKEKLAPGSRVIVPFGRKKYYTAIVVFVHQLKPSTYETKEITALLDAVPILRRPQLKLWEWIAAYYLCSVGEVYKAALPSGLKLESETVVTPNPDYEEESEERLCEREKVILSILQEQDKRSIIEIEKETGLKNILPTVRLLIEKEALFISEQLKSAYRPKTESYVRLTLQPGQQEELRNLFEQLKPAKKQLHLLMAYLDMSRFLQQKVQEVSKKTLLTKAGVSSATLSALIEKGLMEVYQKEISRIGSDEVMSTGNIYPLNEIQQKAFEEIVDSFLQKDVTLLHGITSSGKTEIYIHLIDKVIRQGRQVLYLVPEIALTTQLTERLQRVFGSKLAIYHSKFSDNERVEIWNNLLKNKNIEIILGVRSSVFLPFRDLGLVIVDEEHETTYKQQDPAPRYHARSVAIILASMHGAKTLLGTATPALETYFNACQGKYGLVELNQRFENISLPQIIAVDIKELRRKKLMKGNYSPLLIQHIQEAIGGGEQAILFQNRRGYSPIIECKLCGWIPKCEHCDVSLTYHKRQKQLTCHYCGASYPVPLQCPACGNLSIEAVGLGTERVEDDIAAYFPEVGISRMDLDTTRTRKAHEQLIGDFQRKKTHILIGTQMISKGLDFDNVSVVGILNGDMMMNYPDFRSHERAFQMMTQVAGRAGRKRKQGTVILQTSQPDHPLIRQIIGNNYQSFYAQQLDERQLFKYPPFQRLIYIYLKHRDEQTLDMLAGNFAYYLRQTFGERILGPDNPPVARIQSLFIRKIVLKMEINASMPRVKELLQESYDNMLTDERFKSLILYYDVDPM